MPIWKEKEKTLEEIRKEVSEELRKRKQKGKLKEFIDFFGCENEIREELISKEDRTMCYLKDDNALIVSNYHRGMSAGRLRSLYKCEIDGRIPDIATGDDYGTFMWLKPL